MLPLSAVVARQWRGWGVLAPPPLHKTPSDTVLPMPRHTDWKEATQMLAIAPWALVAPLPSYVSITVRRV